MSRHYIALRDGNLTTIPADFLSKDYQPLVFQTKTSKGDQD